METLACTSLPLRTVHGELPGEENFNVKDTKRKKIEFSPWKQSNGELSREEKTRREQIWSRPLRAVHGELPREENFNAKWKTRREKNIDVCLWEQSTMKSLSQDKKDSLDPKITPTATQNDKIEMNSFTTQVGVLDAIYPQRSETARSTKKRGIPETAKSDKNKIKEAT